MKKLLLPLLALLFAGGSLHAQTQSARRMQNWYFGNKAAVSFATTPPTAVPGSAMDTYEAAASISDVSGNLLFYTNSVGIWNRNHQLMPNAQNLGGNESATQGAVIVPDPTNGQRYYVFLAPSVDVRESVGGLRYVTVDMTARGGLGDASAITAVFAGRGSEKLTAVRHQNGQDMWIVMHDFPGNTFYAYLLGATGLSTTPVVSTTGTVHSGGGGNFNTNNAVGYLRASPDGGKLAMAQRNSRFELFDFSNATGQVSNPIDLGRPGSDSCYGLEFSPDGSRLYGTTFAFSIYQWNLAAGSAAGIMASSTVIGTTSGLAAALAKGPDGKIYVCLGDEGYLGVIANPDLLGRACGYTNNSVFLGSGANRFSLPNFPNVYAPTPNFWTGRVSTAYTEATNWNAGVVPGGADDVLIPAAAVRMPVLGAAAAAQNFMVEPGASLTLAPAGKLSLSGKLTAGGPVGGPGTLATTGLARQVLAGQALLLGHLEIGAAGAELQTGVQVQRVLTLSGTLQTSGQPVTLLSTATETAMVVNNGAAVVEGDVTVQRYVGPARHQGLGYRHVATPVAGTKVEGLATANFAPVTNNLYNTVGRTVRPFPTIQAYSQDRVTSTGNDLTDLDAGWFSPADNATLLTPGAGYTLNMPAGETFAFRGRLHNGPMARADLSRGAGTQAGWHFLGNPYPAPISWTKTFRGATNLDNAVYVFQSSARYEGSYASFVRGVSVNEGTDEIALGQGFFVRTSSGAPAGRLEFTNDARLTSYSNPVFQRGRETRPLVRLQLRGAPAATPDEAVVYVEAGATPDFDAAYDAFKLPAGGPSLALETGNQLLSINGIAPLATNSVVVPLRLGLPQAGSFTVEASELLNLPAGMTAWLRDTQTGTTLNLARQPSYSFTSEATVLKDRFFLVLTPGQVLQTTTQELLQQVAVYPNPAHDQVWLHLPSPLKAQALTVTLANSLGQVVHRRRVAATGAVVGLPLPTLAKGVYTLRAATESGAAVSRRLVVQ